MTVQLKDELQRSMKVCKQLRDQLQKALEERDKIIEKVHKTNKWIRTSASPKSLYTGLKSLNLEPLPSSRFRNATPNRTSSTNDGCAQLTEYIEVLKQQMRKLIDQNRELKQN